MNKAKISNVEETNDILTFNISNIDVCYVNGIRRVILSDIPCYVFKSQPHNDNNINIIINKTRLNNELIKQRMSCIPIHIDDIYNFPFENYVIELNLKNDEKEIIYATSENFKIKNIKTNTYINQSEVKKIFPPNKITGDYIDIVRLRPKLNDNYPSEEIHLEATLTVATANEDGAFSVVSTCSYSNTKDPIQIKEEWSKKENELKEKKLNKLEIEKIKTDWMLLDSKRYYIENSFNFILETIGIYTNYKIMELACNILITKLYKILENIKNNVDLIKEINDTMENSYIIELINEDYTIGKIIENNLYNKYFIKEKRLNYIGSIVPHPHSKVIIIKISAKDILSTDDIIVMLNECVNNSILILNDIKEYFNEK